MSKLILPPILFKRLYFLSTGGIFFFLAATFISHEFSAQVHHPLGGLLLRQVNLALENVAAAWFASMLLLVAALLAVLCFFSDSSRFAGGWQQLLNLGWLAIAGVFAILSFDELGSVHETIGETTFFKKAGSGDGWSFFYSLVLAVGGAMMVFSWMRLRKVSLSLILLVAGVLLYLSNSYQEAYEISSWRGAADPEHWKRPVFFLLLEEGSELAGSFCFVLASSIYLRKVAAAPNSGVININMQGMHKMVQRGTAALFVAGGVLLLYCLRYAVPSSHEDGVPQNWFPAAFCLIVFLLGVYQHTIAANSLETPSLWPVIAFMAISFSFFAGIHLTSHNFASHPLFQLAMSVYMFLAIYVAVQLWNTAPGWHQRLLLAAWICLITCSIFLPGSFTPLFQYGAFGCLAGSFLFAARPVGQQAIFLKPSLQNARRQFQD